MNSWMMLYQLFFLALYRMVYDLSEAGTRTPPRDSPLYHTVESQPTPPGQRQKEWAEKASKRYAEAQQKKWQRWNEAMFERQD